AGAIGGHDLTASTWTLAVPSSARVCAFLYSGRERMKLPRRRFLHLAACTASVSAIPCIARAQAYPSRPITLVVPFAAGGGSDIVARTVAEKMSRTLGQQIIVENRGGGGGTIAMRQVARSAPDGYTLGLGNPGTLAVAPSIYPDLGYD